MHSPCKPQNREMCIALTEKTVEVRGADQSIESQGAGHSPPEAVAILTFILSESSPVCRINTCIA